MVRAATSPTVSMFDLSPEVAEGPAACVVTGAGSRAVRHRAGRLRRQLAGTPAMASRARSPPHRRRSAEPQADAHRDRALWLLVHCTAEPRSTWAITPARSVRRRLHLVTDPREKRVRNVFGATVNDVVLAHVPRGVLRSLLPCATTSIPRTARRHGPGLGPRQKRDKDAMGNQVSSMFALLATDIDDPVQRSLLCDSRRHEDG